MRGAYWLREGTSSKVSFEIKDVVAAALKGGTDSVVLATTTPTGWQPSREDLQATENIVRALGLVKIQLRDHLDPDGNRIFFHGGRRAVCRFMILRAGRCSVLTEQMVYFIK